MAYDGMYGELSTRGSANEILNAILQVQDEIETTQDEVDLTAQEVSTNAAQSAANATAAANYRDQAAANADAALTSSIQAAGYATSAVGASVEADTSADAALVSETNAAASAADALSAELKAEQWSNNPEDVEVETGLYSAFHWSKKAEEYAQIPVDIAGPRLTSIASAVMAVNDILIADTTTTMEAMATGATGRSLIGAADADAARTTIGLNATSITSLAALTMTTDGVPYFTSSSAWSQAASTSYGRSLWSAASATAARTTLGAGAIGDPLFTAATASAARTTLGATTVGNNIFTAASQSAARTSLGSGATGDALFTATTAAGARGTLGLSSNVTFTGQSNNEFLSAGNGTPNANSIGGDPQHWFEITNNPGDDVSAGNQLMRVNSYGALGFGGNIHFCRYRGTLASPTAVMSGDTFKSIGYRGWTGSGLSGSVAAFQVIAEENITATTQGSRFQFQNCPNGTTTRTNSFAISGDRVTSYRNMIVGTGTPSVHGGTSLGVLEIGSSGNGIRGNSASTGLTLVCNLYYDGTNNRYVEATGASGIGLSSNAVAMYGAAVGGGAGALASLSLGAQFRYVTGTGFNAAVAALQINRDASTLRSINAAGTVNASGADYAEYMTKADDCGIVAKGQVVGINSDGKLTDVWSNAVSFVVKSTDPSYVGGDVWGSEEALGVPYPVTPPEGETEAYKAEVAAYEVILEAARQKVDRIAFAGQVPVNVLGANPGDYIVPVQDGTGISAISVASPTFDQYRMSVGKVITIEQDGRARILVKVV